MLSVSFCDQVLMAKWKSRLTVVSEDQHSGSVLGPQIAALSSQNKISIFVVRMIISSNGWIKI